MSDAIGILTSGGDAPGMNAALRAMTKLAASRGVPVIGVENGFTGLLEGRLRPLTHTGPSGELGVDGQVDLLGAVGGTILGSAREPRFMTAQGRAPAVEVLAGLRGLVVVGGNGSLSGAHALAEASGTPVVGVPASIDHDVGCTGTSIGVDTALNTIVSSCDRICDTARAHHRAFVVEVMGRDCGYLAMAAAAAMGAEAVLFREQGRDEAQLVEAVETAIRRAFSERGKRRVLILKSEGVRTPCTRLVRLVAERLGDLRDVDVRATVLGHLVRGGAPSFRDRMVAGRLGIAAVDAVLEGRTDTMVAWAPLVPGGTPTSDPQVFAFPLADVLEHSRALIDGSSPITRRRVAMMSAIEGVLGL
ncbi:MAG: 6-phosphofructokinase [Nannocystaceae bacterium]|nr:6-phosphofructokinase [bacterium]